jgi:uncharacterized phage protein (TIGR01671 family)
MRALKFRAWHDGLMYEVYSIRWNNATIRPGVKEDVAISQIDMINKDARALYHTDGLDKIKLMQFTELFDKNGKEIYEGDVVRIGTRADLIGTVRFGTVSMSINYDEYRFLMTGWYVDNPDESTRTYMTEELGVCQEQTGIEVIGNVYENPELLEVGNV